MWSVEHFRDVLEVHRCNNRKAAVLYVTVNVNIKTGYDCAPLVGLLPLLRTYEQSTVFAGL